MTKNISVEKIKNDKKLVKCPTIEATHIMQGDVVEKLIANGGKYDVYSPFNMLYTYWNEKGEALESVNVRVGGDLGERYHAAKYLESEDEVVIRMTTTQATILRDILGEFNGGNPEVCDGVLGTQNTAHEDTLYVALHNILNKPDPLVKVCEPEYKALRATLK